LALVDQADALPEEFPIAMLVERYYRPLTASVW
jgi:hypothetical protein